MDAEYNYQIKVECLRLSVLAACIMNMFAEPPNHVVGMNKREGHVLGRLVLSSAASQRLLAPGGCQSVSIQVDPHPVSLLDHTNAV